MELKINPILATAIIAGILILCFTVFKGCKQSKLEVAGREKAEHITDSALSVLKIFKSASDSTQNEYAIRDELLSGRIDLLENQKAKTEAQLDDVLKENATLLEKHKLNRYSDTATTVVPREYISDCENCFIKLENTTSLTLKYKSDFNKLQDSTKKKIQLDSDRIKQLESEKSNFYNRMQALAIEAKNITDKLKPHGRLYLSWGVLWHAWPTQAGAGLMYQAKNYMIYGAKCYYGANGTTIETTLNFPLSIKF